MIGAQSNRAHTVQTSGATDKHTPAANDASPFAAILAATAADKQAKPQTNDAKAKDAKADSAGQDESTTAAQNAGEARADKGATHGADNHPAADTAMKPHAGKDTDKGARTAANADPKAAPPQDSKAQPSDQTDPQAPAPGPGATSPDPNQMALLMAGTQPVAASAASADDGDDASGSDAVEGVTGKSASSANATPAGPGQTTDAAAPGPAPAGANDNTPATPVSAARDALKTAQAPKPGDTDSSGQATKKTEAARADAPAAQAAPTQTQDAAHAAQTADQTAAPAQQVVSPQPLNGASAPAAAAGAHLNSTFHVTAQDVAPTMDALAVAVAARSQSGAKQFDIRLDPPELGHVEVRLSIDTSGKVEAHMSADQQQTLDLLQKHSDSLTGALRDVGLDVSQNGLNFSLRGQGGQQQGNDGTAARSPRDALSVSRILDGGQNPSIFSSSGAASDARLDIHV